MKFTFLSILLFVILSAYCQEDTKQWFEFTPKDYFRSNDVDLTDWLDKPAGKHGFMTMQGDDFAFEDGTKVKFWGVNICGTRPFSGEEKVRSWVRFLTKYGINSVRFHKFTWDATDGIHSTEITRENWSRFDYFCKTLQDAGVYYSWSHIYGHRLMPADSARVIAYQEVRDTKFPWSHLNGTTASLVNFAEDLQAVNIELTINMLNHVNPLTGKRYAEDPALTFIELQNEDNIYWGAMEETLKQTPTYRKILCEKFSKWLKQKYGSDEALDRAWNNKGRDKDQSIEKGNIYPNPNHGYFSYAYEQALKEDRPVEPHIADRAAFLFEEQVKFYERFIKAIRQTGYKGVIVGSCWQAGSGITHFYNLKADYDAGAIDRHNYFGGGNGHSLRPGEFNNQSMLTTPGSGLLSTGFQMVRGRPFQISEWMSLIPNEWIAEASPIIATYGLGLQGWDASFAFAVDDDNFTPTLQRGHGIYNVTSPTQLVLYPALAAMIYRGDVKEGKPFLNRNVNIEDLRKGKLGFMEKTSQQYDVKAFASVVPSAALAIGPVTVSFDDPRSMVVPQLTDFIDSTSRTITSNTGQLKWRFGESPFFTVNTSGTQGAVGFFKGETISLKDITITTNNEFAVVLVTSLDRVKGIADSEKILITTMARARNTGMQYSEDKTRLLDTGDAPILLEPVDITLVMPVKKRFKIHILDHTGHKTGKELKVKKGKVRLNGAETRAIYYLIEAAS